MVFYCGVACQKQEWGTHKHVCSALAKAGVQIEAVPTILLLLLKTIARLQTAPDTAAAIDWLCSNQGAAFAAIRQT